VTVLKKAFTERVGLFAMQSQMKLKFCVEFLG